MRLIVNETPYTGREQAGQTYHSALNRIRRGRPVVVISACGASGPQSFVLADRLAYCRFSYLQPLVDSAVSGLATRLGQPAVLPLAIRIEMAPLDPTPSDLHVTTVTVPFNVNRTPGIYVMQTLSTSAHALGIVSKGFGSSDGAVADGGVVRDGTGGRQQRTRRNRAHGNQRRRRALLLRRARRDRAGGAPYPLGPQLYRTEDGRPIYYVHGNPVDGPRLSRPPTFTWTSSRKPRSSA